MITSLGDICRFLNGGTPSRSVDRYFEGDIPWITGADIIGPVAELARTHITPEAVAGSATNVVPAGTVLLVTRTSVGKVAIAGVPLAFSQDITAVLPDERKVIPAYLVHFLRSNEATLKRSARGATIKGITREVIEKLTLDLPSLPKQRRIAAILDQADALRTKRRQALAKLDILTQSVFFEMFGDSQQRPPVDLSRRRDHLASGWEWRKLTDVARLATGHTPSRRKPEYWGGNVPWISLSDIRILDGTVANSTLECASEAGIENSSSVKLPKGTVCFSRTASVGFVTVMGREMATSQDFVNWVCSSNLEPIYLMRALIASRSTLLALANGSTHRTIYFPTVEQFHVLVPPIELQRRFSAIIETLTANRNLQEQSVLISDNLFSSLQHRAFRGEL